MRIVLLAILCLLLLATVSFGAMQSPTPPQDMLADRVEEPISATIATVTTLPEQDMLASRVQTPESTPVESAQAPPQAPAKKSCICSLECSCGCNEGRACDCDTLLKQYPREQPAPNVRAGFFAPGVAWNGRVVRVRLSGSNCAGGS